MGAHLTTGIQGVRQVNAFGERVGAHRDGHGPPDREKQCKGPVSLRDSLGGRMPIYDAFVGFGADR
jgi:hypothetical protein